MWQAQAAKSLGNKQSREMSRSRAKSLTLAGRLMKSSQAKGNVAQSYRQQSNIDYLAARACLGNQDFSPLMEYSEGGTWVAQRLNEKGLKHEGHDRKPSASGSSGVGTTSVGHRSTVPHGRHQRNDSWSRSAIRLARSLPQMCGIMVDSDEKLKSGESEQRLEEALKRGWFSWDCHFDSTRSRVARALLCASRSSLRIWRWQAGRRRRSGHDESSR